MKRVVIKKIPLEMLIECLVDLYNSGMEFVDIVGTEGHENDGIQLLVSEEYLSPDEPKKLNESDIKDLTKWA